jgi:hypothetical protein
VHLPLGRDMRELALKAKQTTIPFLKGEQLFNDSEHGSMQERADFIGRGNASQCAAFSGGVLISETQTVVALYERRFGGRRPPLQPNQDTTRSVQREAVPSVLRLSPRQHRDWSADFQIGRSASSTAATKPNRSSALRLRVL